VLRRLPPAVRGSLESFLQPTPDAREIAAVLGMTPPRLEVLASGELRIDEETGGGGE
jgi:hypothetical protein